MKNLNKAIGFLASITLMLVLGLVGCGGGTEEPLTVSKVFFETQFLRNTSCVTAQTDSTCTLSSSGFFPEPGSAQKNVDVLIQAGVPVIGKKCGSFLYKDREGNPLIALGGTPNFAVLVDIQASGLDKAKALGFGLVTNENLKSFDAIFDCESRRL